MIEPTVSDAPAITCPWCGWAAMESWDYKDDCGDLMCANSSCGKWFRYWRNTSYASVRLEAKP